MNKGALMIPENANIKMILRHSFRSSFAEDDDYKTIGLNDYGILKASEFGESIEYPFGELYSSEINRCIQTLHYMTKGSKLIKIAPDCLTHVFTYDNRLADSQIRLRESLKQIIIDLDSGIDIPGFYTLKDTVKKILDFIFQTGNKEQTIDIYCTHDFHIAMMTTVLFKDAVSLDKLNANWPRMLEGLFIYGPRDYFCCIWRGSRSYFKEFLLV